MALQFSNTTDKNGIIQLVEFYTALGDGGISGNATLLKQMTAQINLAMSEIWHTMWSYQAGWQYDDANQTDLPQATANLQDGIAKVALPTDALTVNRIEIKDKEGNFYKITPITERQIGGAIPEFFETAGMPLYYRLLGRTIELFPAPATAQVTLTSGMKVYFDRTGVAFASTDTTDTPGFSGEYHDLVPIKASIKWLQVHKPDSPTLSLLMAKELARIEELKEFEANKWKDRKPFTITGLTNNSR